MESTTTTSGLPPESTTGQRDATPAEIAQILDENCYMNALLDVKVLATLDLRYNPSVQSAIRYMAVQGGTVVDTIGSPLLCVLFEMPGKLFCIYSDISKRFYNADPSQKVPAAVRSIQYIEHLNRIGIYIGTETNEGVSTGRNLYVFMDLALNKSPVYIEEDDKWYPYYVCEANSDTLVGYYETLTKTIVS